MQSFFLAVMIAPLLSWSAFAQGNLDSTPRKPQESGMSLESALQSIKTELAQQKTLTYSRTMLNDNSGTFRMTNISQGLEESAPCNISYTRKHREEILTGGVRKIEKLFATDTDQEDELPMSGMTRIDVVPSSEYYSRHLQPFQDQPEIFYIWAHLKRGTTGTHREHTTYPFNSKAKPFDSSSPVFELNFLFAGEDQAKRAALALRRAVEFCGGGQPDEPFWPFPL